MSLQVWLPLNGNLDNQGLNGNVSITNNGATINSAGKIGQCYSFDGTNDYLNITNYNFGGLSEFSISFWCYSTSATLVGICQIKAGTAVAFQLGDSSFNFRDSKHSSLATVNYTAPTANVWTHYSFIYNGGSWTIYKDGVQDGSGFTGSGATFYSDSTTFYIGRKNITSGNTYYNGKLNDFRVYDHALSAKEAVELAKGLVLHYKLDNPYNESTINLGNTSATYSNFAHGYTVSCGAWGGDAGTCTFYRYGGYNGYPYKVYHKTAIGTGGIYLKTANDIIIEANKTYTVSVYVKASRNFTDNHYSFNINRGSDNNYITSGHSITYTTEWTRQSWTFTATSAQAGTYGEMSIIYNDDETDYYVYYSGFQIEEKDHATPYTPSSRSENTIYDTSGYKYNGTIFKTAAELIDTPRYSYGLSLLTTSSKVAINNLYVTGFSNSYSIAWWGKVSKYAGVMMWGFGNGIRLNGIFNGNLWNTGDSADNPLYNPGTTIQVTAPTANTWHHFVMTGNGTQCLVYKDGVLWAQAKTYKSITGSIIYLNGWSTDTSYSLANTQLSDFRIYSTALSAAAVKELYDTSGTIDNNGNVYAREVIE